MPDGFDCDAVVVGSGPNGLAAAITLARAGRSVVLVEAKDTVGGGARTAELTLPGFRHDICSAIHPLGFSSPFFRSVPLVEHGVEWVHPPAAVAHPLDDGTAAVLEPSIEATADTLGVDGAAYLRFISPLVRDWEGIVEDLLGPLRVPRHPRAVLRFGMRALRSVRGLAGGSFRGERAPALVGGIGAHSALPLERPSGAAVALLLAVAGHATGWPLIRGGSQRLADGLAGYFMSLGGRVVTGRCTRTVDELSPARAVLLDVSPRQVLHLAGHRLPGAYRARLQAHPYGPGVFKLDWALDCPIPWRAVECSRAATVHVGGTIEEIAAAERAVWHGEVPERPFVVLAQQSLFDPCRAPHGKHTAWAYCRVPNGAGFDMTGRIEDQIERFAPGFRDCIIARSALSPNDLERYNPNYVGGDIGGGVQDLWRLFARPGLRRMVYSTPVRGIYMCSSSTPPGGGVHGMCGYHAARVVLREMFAAGGAAVAAHAERERGGRERIEGG